MLKGAQKMRRLKNIEINSDKLRGKIRKDKAEKCAKHMLTIYQSNYFRKLILDMDRGYWLKGESDNSAFKYLSNEQIYEKLMSGAEEWNNKVDNVLQLYVMGYLGKIWSKVVGYMIPGKRTIHVNHRFFDSMSIEKCISNFGHEGSHTCGSRHSGPFFRQSFGYFVNFVIEKSYKHLIRDSKADIYVDDEIPASRQPIYKKVCRRTWYFRTKCSMILVE